MGDTKISGRIVTVRHPDREIYALFADLGHFAEHLPEDVKEKSSLEFDTDHLLAKVQGFEFGIKVEERVPFTMVKYIQFGTTPVSFDFFVNIEALSEDTCSFRLSLDAQLGTMMKMMVGGKLKEAVDRLTDELEKRLI
jgi:hypothetical protein